MDKFRITWKCGDCDVMHDVVMEGNGVATALHGTIESIMMTMNTDNPRVYIYDSEKLDWVDVTNEIYLQILEFEVSEDIRRMLGL